MGSQQDFLEDVTSNNFTSLNLQKDQRDVPDTFDLGACLMLPVEPSIEGLLLKTIDHQMIHIKTREVEGLFFNWPLNDSEGYILELKDGRRLLMKKDSARIGTSGKLEPVSQMHQNAYKQFIVQLKMNLTPIKKKCIEAGHPYDVHLWVRKDLAQ